MGRRATQGTHLCKGKKGQFEGGVSLGVFENSNGSNNIKKCPYKEDFALNSLYQYQIP